MLSAVLLAMSGGVDEIVDWSRTAPKRKSKRPADTAGDFDDKVSAILLCFELVCSSWGITPKPKEVRRPALLLAQA